MTRKGATSQQPPGWLTLLVLTVVCIAIASTYFATRIAIDTIAPFLAGSLRYILSGIFLFCLSRFGAGQHVSRAHWRSAVILGAMGCLGTSVVNWAQQLVPVGLTALIMAMIPVYVVVLEWLLPGGIRPKLGVVVGLVFSLGGMFLIIGPSSVAQGSSIAFAGVVGLIIGGLNGAATATYIPRASVPTSPMLAMAMQMTIGGVFMLVVAGLAGNLQGLTISSVSISSALALAHLAVVGSLAYTGYFWLLRTIGPTLPSSAQSYSTPGSKHLAGMGIPRRETFLADTLGRGGYYRWPYLDYAKPDAASSPRRSGAETTVSRAGDAVIAPGSSVSILRSLGNRPSRILRSSPHRLRPLGRVG